MEPHDPATPTTEVWPPPPTTDPTPVSRLSTYVSARRLAQIVIALTWAGMAGSALTASPVVRALAITPASAGVFTQSSSLVLLASSLCFFVWTHRVYKNLRALGAQGLHYTPAWAVGLIFGGLAVIYLIHNFQTLSRLGAPQPYFGQSSVATTWVGWGLNIGETLLFTLVVRAITERQEKAAGLLP